MDTSPSENVLSPGTPTAERSLSDAAVRQELARLLRARPLREAEMLKRFLGYVVERALAGEGDQLKEYRLGLEVFNREDSFDPRLDPVVRMAARRLRIKLLEYYEAEGRQDPIRIDIPKGGYTPVFVPVSPAREVSPLSEVGLGASLPGQQKRRPSWMPKAVARIGVCCLLGAAVAYSIYRLRPERVQARRGKIMLAVLPFANLSGDASQEFLSDGLTEEFIARLGALNPSQLGVIARTSVMAYKSTSKHVDEIGRELGVQYVLEGSVRESGKRARITVQLIQVRDQTHLWAQSFEESSDDLLKMETEIAQAAAGEISVSLKQPRPQGPQTVQISPEAHGLYLEGRYFWNKRGTADLLKAIDYFQQALQKEPRYALAYVGLADAYNVLAANDQMSPAEAVPRARAAADKALELDGSLTEAHIPLAHILFFYDWNYAGAEAEYRKGLEENPGYATAHHLYGVMLLYTGRLREAQDQLQQAQVLDPLSPANSVALGLEYLYSGQNDLALDLARRTLAFAPSDPLAHALMGFYYERQRMYGQGVREMEQAVQLSHRNSEMVGWWGWLLALSGRRAEALRAIQELQAPSAAHYTSAFDVGIVYAGLSENDQALQYLRRSIDRHEADAISLKMHPAFDSLRDDPRFQTLLFKTGLGS